MDQQLTLRLVTAIERGIRARSRFYASIDLDDEQLLGPPASINDIDSLEKACGRELPASYKLFLAMHNGWVMVDGGCDLLSTAQMLSGSIADQIRKWQKSMAKSGDELMASGLVIGFSAISQKRIVLDLDSRNGDNECRLIQWDSDEFIEYVSFIGWLEESAIEFEELVNAPGDDAP